MRELLRGYVITTLCGWSVFPLLHRLLGRLPDRGYSLCRCFGLILASWIAWMLTGAARLQLTTPIALLAVLLTAALSAVAAAPWGRPSRATDSGCAEGFTDFLKRGTKWLVCVEGLFLGGLLLFGWLLRHHPSVDPDSERFMDYALLRACLRSRGLPIMDPWFAGENLTYYHFGHAMVAFLVRAAGADPARFFITAVALQHALLWAGAFGAGLALTGRTGGGFLAAFFVLGAGNGEWIGQCARSIGPGRLDWFAASRAIEGTITEFPWFSMLWGDLHPYVMALPITACALAIALAEGLPPDKTGGAWSEDTEHSSLWLGRAACFALVCGAVLVTHPWDFPVVLCAAALLSIARPGRGKIVRLSVTALAGAASSLLFLPFLKGFVRAGRGLGRVSRGSAPGEWLMAYFPFVLLAVLSAALLLPSILRRRRGRGIVPVRDRLALAVAGTGLLAAIACEIVYVRDLFESTPLYRMNTVFKLHRLAWLLLGVSAPALVGRLLARERGGAACPARPIAAWTGLAVVLAGALVYPVWGTAAWLRARSVEPGRSGDARLATARSPGADADALFRALSPGDAAAAAFLASSAAPGEAVLEETGEPYSWSSRISTFSGVPTVLGWGNHEAIWRQGWEGVLERSADVQTIYTGSGPARACDLMRRYGVRWMVVGERERQRYGEDAGRVAAIGRKVFESHETTVYDVRAACGPGVPAGLQAP